jgi:hypothetical protein
MPWLPPGTSTKLLANIPEETLLGWANGEPVGPPPHTLREEVYAFEINRDFQDPTAKPPIQYKKGMQGQFLGQSKASKSDTMLAKIYILGVTEGPGFVHRMVPLVCITKGKRWEFDTTKWDLQLRLVRGTFDTRNWTPSDVPDNTLLGKTITRLITAFHASPPMYISEKLTEFVKKYTISAVAKVIIDGMKKAGMYDVMKHGTFNRADMIRKATCKVDHTTTSNKGGVYARLHTSSSTVSNWLPNTTYIYIGKSVDFKSRFSSHPATPSVYGDLTRNSSDLSMIALCVLPPAIDIGLYLLTEQVFICLLQTYKKGLLERQSSITDSSDSSAISFFAPAQHCTDITREVMRQTGWTGGVSRSDFGVAQGANCSSPLLEWANTCDKLLYIRTDFNAKDGETGQVVPMAHFRRALQPVAGPAKNQARRVKVFKLAGRDVAGNISMVLTYPVAGKTLADCPLPGTPYQLVFEVRKDGSPHPHSWARLPEIGRPKNWGQANSFAVRIEWQYPAESGKWRFRYIQAGHASGDRLFGRVNDNIGGSFLTYAKALAFLQWLTGTRSNQNSAWVPVFPGCARVLLAEYNRMNQSILFRHAKDDEKITMISGLPRSDNEIKARMRQPQYDLQNVDGAFGVFEGEEKGEGSRKSCDTCALIPNPTHDLELTCKQMGNENYCTNCWCFGRSCCSWSPNLRSHDEDSTGQTLTKEEFERQQVVVRALLFQPVQDIPETMQSFTQILTPLDHTELPEDDGSDVDSGDEGVVDDEHS